MEDHAHLVGGVREAIDAEFPPESAHHQIPVNELEEADGVFGALLAVLVLNEDILLKVGEVYLKQGRDGLLVVPQQGHSAGKWRVPRSCHIFHPVYF